QILKSVADLLASQARASDVCARYGGEEFCLLLPETSKDGGRVKAERLRELMHASHFPGVEALPEKKLTLSLGVAEFPADAPTADDLLSRADHALYVAKGRGRDRVQTYGEGEAPEAWKAVPPPEARPLLREPRLPDYQQRLGDIVDVLDKQRMVDCLLIDLERLRRIEAVYGSVTHGNLLWRAGEILGDMRGARFRETDLVCRLSETDSFVIFLGPARAPSPPGSRPLGELEQVADRIANWLDRALARDVQDLLHDTPRAAVGYARV